MSRPLRVLRQIVAPAGRHRAASPRGVVDEATLARLLSTGDAAATECAHCPACARTTAHAMQRDGSRRCWTCNTITPPPPQEAPDA